MNIKSVSIKNFRNFNDFVIDFSDGFQTIIGENNIGKSNLYWAIRLVLDKNLPYNTRVLETKDIHGFKSKIDINDNVIISIELFSENLASFPTFHAFKTSDNTARVTYLFAHKSKFIDEDEVPDNIEISQFKWRLYAGGNSLNIDDLLELDAISFRDLEGINIYYINAFRNIKSELHGNTKSLLSKYCQSRENSEKELDEVKTILKSSSTELNGLDFVPDVAQNIKEKGNEIAGQYFSFPISISFLSNYDVDAWSQLNLFYNPNSKGNVPIQSLGLGQKNVLYLSLFIAELENSSNKYEINLLLIEEPEAHLHPQLQKILFSNLNNLKTTQVFMTSHSTHIASDCEYKNLNVLYLNGKNQVKSFAPFKDRLLTPRENNLLKRYLDATRSEMFFSSAILYVEGVGEQFIIPAIATKVFEVNLTEHNVSVIPIYSRYFDPYLKLVQENSFEIPVAAIIDGDKDELNDDEESTTAVENAKKYEIEDRVLITQGTKTLEIDLFPSIAVNGTYLNKCFKNLGHEKSYDNLVTASKNKPELWESELIKRIDNTVTKGRFAQELSLLIDKDFVVPDYITEAITHVMKRKVNAPFNA